MRSILAVQSGSRARIATSLVVVNSGPGTNVPIKHVHYVLDRISVQQLE